MNTTPDTVIAETRAWVTHAVIGLNFCPFARSVQAKDQIRYVVSDARSEEALLGQLCDELAYLVRADPHRTETTLIIHPWVLNDFVDFNDFLDPAEAAIDLLGLSGVLQLASFHPQYQFAGTEAGDLGNASNRSPYPTLQLLREASLERALAAFPSTQAIYEKNIRTLEALGAQGWSDLQERFRRHARDEEP